MGTSDELTPFEQSKQYDQALIAEFRAQSGKVSGWEDNPLLLLTTIGARSGQPHTKPLSYTTDGDRIIVFAGNSGAPDLPDWYYNLVAHPEVTVELGRECWQTRAVVATGQEHERLWNRRVEEAPWIVELQRKAKRQVPVVILARAGATAS
jgi:deazaflavin-dependent oxidoreductase (nitroreductase family)